MIIDMDKTIEGLLKNYREYIKTLIVREGKIMLSTKYKTEIDRECAEQDFWNLKRADNLLKLIVEDPKKYLYRKKDIIYTSVDVNKQPCDERSDLPSVFEKLEPIDELLHKYRLESWLYLLSVCIAAHVNSADANKPWIYSGIKGRDINAEIVLKINKYVSLLPVNDVVRVFKSIVPARRFAVRSK